MTQRQVRFTYIIEMGKRVRYAPAALFQRLVNEKIEAQVPVPPIVDDQIPENSDYDPDELFSGGAEWAVETLDESMLA
eukprot:3139552-Rhodomonas_salina.1